MALSMDDWKKLADEFTKHQKLAKETGKPVVVAKRVQYGCNCTECNEHYPHAEVRDNFVCYSCKSYKSMFE